MSRNPLIKKEFVNEGKVFFGRFPAVLEVKEVGEEGEGGREEKPQAEWNPNREKNREMSGLQYDPCWTLEVGPLKKVLEQCYCLIPSTPIYMYPKQFYIMKTFVL